MRDSIFRAEGLGFVLDYPDLLTSFHVDRLRVSSGDTKGDVMIRSRHPAARPYNDDLVHYSRETLSSSTARKSLGKIIYEKIKIGDEKKGPLDWADYYDEFCTMVMLADREGAQPELVGQLDEVGGEPVFLLEPLVPFGTHSILFGDGGLGKSIMAVAMAVSSITGKEIVPGFRPVQSGPVVYLNWETNPKDIDRRVKAVCSGAGVPPVSLVHVSGQGRTLASRIESVARLVDRTGAVMLIIDSMGKAIGTAGEGPIEDAVNRFSSALDEIGRSALCIDHVSKLGARESDGAGKPIGSTMKSNWARATWEMRRSGEDEDDGESHTSHLVLYHRKHNTSSAFAPIGLAMNWRPGIVRWEQESVEDRPSLAYGAPLADRIAALLAEHPLRPRELAMDLGESEASVRTILNRNKMRFTKVATGDWALAERNSS